MTKKKPKRLTQELLETADDMRRVGIIDAAAHEKIMRRHLVDQAGGLKRERIVKHTARDLAAKRRRGETRSDWAKAAAATDEQLAASIAADPDEAGMVVDWDTASLEMPKPLRRRQRPKIS